jgi:hypothetical protein
MIYGHARISVNRRALAIEPHAIRREGIAVNVVLDHAVFAVVLFAWHSTAPARALPFPLLYVSPDQLLSLPSIFGAMVGVLLMFWHRIVGVVHRIRGFISRRQTDQR